MTFSGPGGRPAHSPNFFQCRRASTALFTFTIFFETLKRLMTFTFRPRSSVVNSTTVLMSSPPTSGALAASAEARQARSRPAPALDVPFGASGAPTASAHFVFLGNAFGPSMLGNTKEWVSDSEKLTQLRTEKNARSEKLGCGNAEYTGGGASFNPGFIA